MCGRYSLFADPLKFMSEFEIENLPFDRHPSYNVSPGQLVPAIFEDRGSRRAGQLRWGLVPSWAQVEKIGYKMINARAETLTEKPAFRNLFTRKRCIIPADGFYEWMKTEKGKQPMRIMMKDGRLFAFAGLFDTWTNPAGEKVHSCTIITTKPNPIVADIHDRMPVILRKEDEGIWLDRERHDADLLRSLLVPYNETEMHAYPVSSIVGNVKNDVPDCIKQIAE